VKACIVEFWDKLSFKFETTPVGIKKKPLTLRKGPKCEKRLSQGQFTSNKMKC
jgi:hypothetical protein